MIMDLCNITLISFEHSCHKTQCHREGWCPSAFSVVGFEPQGMRSV